MPRFCNADRPLINFSELKCICFIYIFLVACFLTWYIYKIYDSNNNYNYDYSKKKKKKTCKYTDEPYKYIPDEEKKFFSFTHDSSDPNEIVVRQEGYKSNSIGWALRNTAIILYLLTHIFIITLIGNEYCILENSHILWNDRALIFFILLMLSFVLSYVILIMRKHMNAFFLKPTLLKNSDYVIVYTKSEDYGNIYKGVYFQMCYNFFVTLFKNCCMILVKLICTIISWISRCKKQKQKRKFFFESDDDILYRQKESYYKKQEQMDKPDKRVICKGTDHHDLTKPSQLIVHKVKVRINEKNGRYFFFRSMKYVYDEKKDYFCNISHNIKEHVQSFNFNYILKKGGLNNNEIINNINNYGFTNLRREIIDGIYLFQLFITYKNLFWKEIITSVVWLLISILAVISKIIKNQKNKKEIYTNMQASNNTIVTVYRNSIAIDDIVIINPKLTIPCDCLLLTGQVLVDESFLTGESKAQKKTCISNLNNSNFYEESKYVSFSSDSDIYHHSKTNQYFNHNENDNKEKTSSIYTSNGQNSDNIPSSIKQVSNYTNSNSNIWNTDVSSTNKNMGYYDQKHMYTHMKKKKKINEYNTNNILYAGTNVISTLNYTNNIYAIVINVSIYTYKGKYMQNVLFPNPLLFKYDSQLPIVFLFTILFALVCLFLQIKYLGFNMTSIFYSIGTLSQILPIWTPVVLNIGLNVSTKRLKNEKQICCIAPSRIPICGKVRLFFFDKTGTITDHNIVFCGVHFCNNLFFKKHNKRLHNQIHNQNTYINSISDKNNAHMSNLKYDTNVVLDKKEYRQATSTSGLDVGAGMEKEKEKKKEKKKRKG
ncbi:cation transporting P-ATPase, putative [Hepatocystis sp. ex Piliocolobus tephrosceles]|nr:cation transporting P-ATPase, putative [Hepatocystis sp. ex Piliocolobus tephrosceles]